jgi:hypothetical protein
LVTESNAYRSLASAIILRALRDVSANDRRYGERRRVSAVKFLLSEDCREYLFLLDINWEIKDEEQLVKMSEALKSFKPSKANKSNKTGVKEYEWDE